MILKKYGELFDDKSEDQQMLDLKFLCKKYDRQVAMALLPYYMDRLEFLQAEIEEKHADAKTSKADLDFLQGCIDQIRADKDKETADLMAQAQAIYELWGQVKKARADKEYQDTFYQLKVHQGQDDMDILFNLQKQNDQIELERSTQLRKDRAEKTLVKCALRIDGVEVAKTNGVKINWPSFECDILDQFQIHVFTLPTDIELDIIVGGTLVDRILLDVPGNHVKSLTSASRLI